MRSYLCAYYDRLNVNRQRDQFKLDLIDGFAGGGLFRDGNETVSGSPLVMLEETAKATERLNQGRAKRLHIDCKFYFVDKEKAHTDHLRRTLKERGHDIDNDRIVIRTGQFQDEIDAILSEIRKRQPRAGRAIFLLDQTGFSQVELCLVSRILQELPAAEIILTFAADALINHLTDSPSLRNAVAPLELTEVQIQELIQHRDVGGRAVVQRALRTHIRNTIRGLKYDTPFFIRPTQSRRALWFFHLSRHPTARDVMIQQHWDLSNTFEHYGPGGFGMLGWDTLVGPPDQIPLFDFGEIATRQIKEQLLNAMPDRLYSLASECPVTVDAMQHAFANETAARFSDMDKVLLQLHKEKAIDILSPDGKSRRRDIGRVFATDRIAIPAQQMFSILRRS